LPAKISARLAAKVWNRHGHESGVGFCRRRVTLEKHRRLSGASPDRGVAFVSIIPLLANSSFDPEAVEILSGAFDDAWEEIKRSGSNFARPAYERGAREVLAKYIIELAQRGERDRQALCKSAVEYLAQNYKQ
jgi:hypothetical protein